MPKCLYCQDEIPDGMMVCPTCLNDLTPSGDCRKCLHFNYCTDKGNHAYRGCSNHFIDKYDYVKVVRCKDCKTAIGFGGKVVKPDEVGICKMTQMCVAPEDFCSYGKRRKSNV